MRLLNIFFFAAVFLFCCSDPIDLCETVTCENEGTCVTGICNCTENFSGTNCEIRECYACWKVGEANVRICKNDFPGDTLSWRARVESFEAADYKCQ